MDVRTKKMFGSSKMKPLKNSTKHMSMLDLKDLSRTLLDVSNHKKDYSKAEGISSEPLLKPCLRAVSCYNGENEEKTAPRNNPSAKTVIFHKVIIREYERTLGDNPSVRRGPAISIGWRYVPDAIVIDLDEYETTRPPRRSKNEIIVPETVRMSMLKEYEFTTREIMAATKEVNITRKQRIQTARSTESTERAHFLLEKAGRKIKHVFGNKKHKKQEAKLWNNAIHSAMQKAHSTNDLQALSSPAHHQQHQYHSKHKSIKDESHHNDGIHSEEFTSFTEPDFGVNEDEYEFGHVDDDLSSTCSSRSSLDGGEDGDNEEENVVVSEKTNHFGSKRILSTLDFASLNQQAQLAQLAEESKINGNNKNNNDSISSLTGSLGSVPEITTNNCNDPELELEQHQVPQDQQAHLLIKQGQTVVVGGDGGLLLVPDMEATSEDDDDEWGMAGDFF